MSHSSDQPHIHFGGLVIGSADPERASAWYQTAFGGGGETMRFIGRPLVDVGGASLVFDRRDDVVLQPVEPGRLLLNFYVTGIQEVETRLNGLGVAWIRPVEHVAGLGSIGTLTDNDGNYIQLLEPEKRA